MESSVSVGTIIIGDSALNGGLYQNFTIQPNTGTQTLTLGSGGITSSNSVNTINSNMILGANTSVQHTNASGSLNLHGGVNLGNRVLTVAGSGNTFIGGAMTGTGSLIKTGAGNLTLTGINPHFSPRHFFAGEILGGAGLIEVLGACLGFSADFSVHELVGAVGETGFSLDFHVRRRAVAQGTFFVPNSDS